MFHKGGAVAIAPDDVHGMAHQDHGLALYPARLKHLDRLFLEFDVPDGKHLVQEHDVGACVDGNGKSEAGDHARGKILDLGIHELFQLGKGNDLVEDLVYLLDLESEHGA